MSEKECKNEKQNRSKTNQIKHQRVGDDTKRAI